VAEDAESVRRSARAASGSATPTTWRPREAGLVRGPSTFITVGMASSRRIGATWRMAGWWSGANMKTIPASSSTRASCSGERSSRTPSISSTSALPQREVKLRFPCLATITPAPAARSAAAVEMLKVVSVPRRFRRYRPRRGAACRPIPSRRASPARRPRARRHRATHAQRDEERGHLHRRRPPLHHLREGRLRLFDGEGPLGRAPDQLLQRHLRSARGGRAAHPVAGAGL
jgi:hypothetical protein